MPVSISPTQNAFIPTKAHNRECYNGIGNFVFNEKRHKGSTSSMAPKFDMSKAYNCIEWCFWKQ